MSGAIDLAGIGAGPFNLAVAALLHRQPLSSRFFEAKPTFNWHPGLMLPGALLQTSYLKDLVTPVDPTNPYSFLAYLVSRRRFYDFMNAEQPAVSRQEFADYLGWVAAGLPNLELDSPIDQVEDAGEHFRLHLKGETVLARNLCVGTGKRPYIPANCKSLLSEDCFHALGIAHRDLDLRGKRVAVVGGGQTGAEIVLNAINNHWGRPEKVLWVSRRSNYLPLDETPFTNDWFTPHYAEAFRDLNPARKTAIVNEQKLASDGISPVTLKALYQRFYELNHVEGDANRIALLPNRELQSLTHTRGYGLTLENRLNDDLEYHRADVVIFCTGLEEVMPDCLAPLADRLQRDERGHLILNQSFATRLEGANGRKLYMLNVGRYTQGIAEPQMSLSAWRAACVVNDVLNHEVYETRQANNCMQWIVPPTQEAAVA